MDTTASQVISNSYIPPRLAEQNSRFLNRVALKSLLELVKIWSRWPATKPKHNIGSEVDLFTESNITKKKLIDKILVEYWPNGLNLLQLSQIDTQLIVKKPSASSMGSSGWTSSMAKIPLSGEELMITIEPQLFLDQLMTHLSKVYLCHSYVAKHPVLPLTIIRVQVFDFIPMKKRIPSKDELVSHKPFFLAIPQNSPFVIHTAFQDSVTKTIMQSIELTLSSSTRQVVLAPTNDPPVKTLEALHIFKGNSRFSNSLGSWQPYADGDVDMPVLGEEKNHPIVKVNRIDNNAVSNRPTREQIAMLRFKGTVDPLKSERLFEDTRAIKEVEEDNTNPYSSIAPVQFVKLALKSADDSNENPITIKFTGTDVYAGLYELAVKGPVDAALIPEALTGEYGVESGTLENGKFTKEETILLDNN
ncbi:Outer kinetochore protein [Komagataella phaffii CBS 7435]|uniref:Outer kinetochore protein required for chromosome stability n=2 Tax=Komagataella phaffii TaxID=460519 RepID=C4R3V4_KOMPG|nr:Outer kinetochore protein required for chromosome stability [Komagataella phaffii GS115]AOA63322.1 GQ67_03252T0 [Komagataella phaffii]CAH2450020.1 Outer kinetochore protein [Komagataella phaffii CBS 7435]AOA68884.1 GQ68_03221T0 [Komagataella phaffii GS115]CAY70205.1 Outer kinetochore protein required for chromosome stability [Komagataella phaffii GS115]CCA39964.1 Outer kinetochore protein [Komagataella phaffii CBS 7435]